MAALFHFTLEKSRDRTMLRVWAGKYLGKVIAIVVIAAIIALLVYTGAMSEEAFSKLIEKLAALLTE